MIDDGARAERESLMLCHRAMRMTGIPIYVCI